MEKIENFNTNDILNFLIQIDNGLFDEEIEYFNKYEELENYRNNIINILIKRYNKYIENKENISDNEIFNLEKAFSIYLRFYL